MTKIEKNERDAFKAMIDEKRKVLMYTKQSDKDFMKLYLEIMKDIDNYFQD